MRFVKHNFRYIYKTVIAAAGVTIGLLLASPATSLASPGQGSFVEKSLNLTPSASRPQVMHASYASHSTGKFTPVTVARVVDGDTIHVTMPGGSDADIRMLLIDTPEDVKPGTPVEPFSLKAAAYARKVLPVGKHIFIQEGKPGYTLDKYGRLLAYVFISKSDMYNEDVVKKGFARVAYIYPPNLDYLSTLQEDEAYAKSRKLGIWSIPGYVTPYGYNLAAAHLAAAKHTSTASSRRSVSSTSSKASNASTSKSTSTRSTSISSNSSSTTISVAQSNLSVSPGGEASITIHAAPHVTASIQVLYKSGPSHAHGLGDEKTDGNGNATWTWYVGSNTTPGDWKVIITVGGRTLTTLLHVR